MRFIPIARIALASLCAAALGETVGATTLAPKSPVAPQSYNAAAVSNYLSTVKRDGALAYYPLADTNATMRDFGPYAINGTYGSGVSHGGPAITAMGTSSAAFSGGSFNRNLLAAAPINGHLQPAGSVTVEAWVQEKAVNLTNAFVPVVVYGKQATGPAYSLTISPQNTAAFWGRTTSGSVSGGSYQALIPGKIYHLVATFNGQSVAMYVNGHLQGTAAGRGTLNYGGLNARDGLAMGGALDTGHYQFDGEIGDVAVYGKALSALQVASHFVAGVQPLVLNEPANASNAFVNSVGVNVHLHYTGSVYDRDYAQIRSYLIALGVHHIRDGLIDTQWKTYYDRLNDLGRSGIKSTLTTTRDQSAALLASYPSRVSASLEAFEAPNEMDLVYRNDPQWPQKAAAFQKLLWNTIKGNRNTAGYRILGPSFTSQTSIQRVGNISAYMNTGNFHEYFSGYDPGTEGWGSHQALGIVGSMSYNVAIARLMSGNLPLVATETGYNTGIANGNVPFDMQAKYLPRLMLELYNHGVSQSMIYELADWNPSDHANNFGLIASNVKPKPAYYALQSLLGMLKDTGNAAPSSLKYTIGGDFGNVEHTLLRKSDGSYYLALWIETRDWLPTNDATGGGVRVPVSPQTVTVTFPKTITSASQGSIGDNGAVTTSKVTVHGSSLTTTTTNNVLIVRVTM